MFEKIFLTKIRGHHYKYVLFFQKAGYKILTKHCYVNRRAPRKITNTVTASAAIIRDDIRSYIYDAASYPPSYDFLKDVNNCIPESFDMPLKYDC